MTEMDETINVRVLADKIAAEMGDGWTAEDGYHDRDALLVAPVDNVAADGVRLHLATNGQWRQADRGKLTVRPSFPDGWVRDHLRYDESIPTIKVSADKAPRTIARDIARRLLPDAVTLTLALRHRAGLHDAAERARDGVVAEIAAAFGRRAKICQGRDGLDRVQLGRYGDPVSGDARVMYGGGEVEVTLRLTSGHAVELAAFLATLTID